MVKHLLILMFTGMVTMCNLACLSLWRLLAIKFQVDCSTPIQRSNLADASFLKAIKSQYGGHFVPLAGSLWHKDRRLPRKVILDLEELLN